MDSVTSGMCPLQTASPVWSFAVGCVANLAMCAPLPPSYVGCSVSSCRAVVCHAKLFRQGLFDQSLEKIKLLRYVYNMAGLNVHAVHTQLNRSGRVNVLPAPAPPPPPSPSHPGCLAVLVYRESSSSQCIHHVCAVLFVNYAVLCCAVHVRRTISTRVWTRSSCCATSTTRTLTTSTTLCGCTSSFTTR